ncbi:MAG: CU044_2847 family protein [Cyanobacteria bacterium P01_G01_bin.54]
MGIERGRASQLILLDDGALVEVTSDEYAARPLSSNFASRVKGSLHSIAPAIEKACAPVLKALAEVRARGSKISKAEIELGFNIEPDGNAYIAQVASDASIKVKLIVERDTDSIEDGLI